jgi:hypothetical protein
LDRTFGGAGVACPRIPSDAIAPAGAAEEDKTSVFALPDGRTVLGGQIQDLSENVEWILGAYRPTFVTPVGCLAVRVLGRRGGSVTVALARAARFGIDVTQVTVPGFHRRFLGRVTFGVQPRGLRMIPWSLRVRGRPIRPEANRIYELTPITLSRTGRVTARGSLGLL